MVPSKYQNFGLHLRFPSEVNDLLPMIWSESGDLRAESISVLASIATDDFAEQLMCDLFEMIKSQEREGISREVIASGVLRELQSFRSSSIAQDSSSQVETRSEKTLEHVLSLTHARPGSSMKVTDVAVQLAPQNQDRLRGLCCITLDGCFVVRDIKIINGPNGPFVAMPSRKIMASCPGCRTKNHLHALFCNQCGAQLPAMVPSGERVKMHCDVAHPITAECRQMIEKEILAAFDAETHKAQQPGYVAKTIGDGGETLASFAITSPNARR